MHNGRKSSQCLAVWEHCSRRLQVKVGATLFHRLHRTPGLPKIRLKSRFYSGRRWLKENLQIHITACLKELSRKLTNTFDTASHGLSTGESPGREYSTNITPMFFRRLSLVRYGKAVYGEDERSIFSLPDRNDILSAIRPRYETIRKYAKQTDDDTMHWLGNLGPTVQRYADVLENELSVWEAENH